MVAHLRPFGHSYAGNGFPVGEALPMIGNLLRHNKVQTAANRIASRIAEDAGRYPVGHAGAGMAARGAPLAWSCKVKSVEASNLPTSIAFMAYCW